MKKKHISYRHVNRGAVKINCKPLFPAETYGVSNMLICSRQSRGRNEGRNLRGDAREFPDSELDKVVARGSNIFGAVQEMKRKKIECCVI
ncbi:hypothetical protein OROMI_007181 [Orobanche minor]